MAGWGNSFSLLDEDESGEGIVRVPVKVAAPVAAKKEEVKPAPKSAVDNKDSQRKPDNRRDDRRPPRAREERGEESNQASDVATQERGQYRQRGSGERSGGERRERAPRDAAATGGAGARAPRQYDRKSGTGRGREEKRGGAGRGNWGSNDEEIALESQAVAVEGETATDAEPAAAVEGEAAPAAEPVAPRELSEEEKQRQADREAEAKLMTLDEYLKQKKSLDIKLPEPRKAGEGEDDKQWAGFIAAKSDKAASEEGKKETAGEKKEKAAKKVALPADMLRFKGEQQRRDSERRERPARDGDFRPRREEGARPPRPAQEKRSAPKTAAAFEPTDFPSLGGAPAPAAIKA